MKMYVKPSIEVIELQLTENIAAVPTTVYKGSKGSFTAVDDKAHNIALKAKNTGLKQDLLTKYQISTIDNL